MTDREVIAKRIAKELQGPLTVNLGIGIPTLVPQFLEQDCDIVFQGDNGVLGMLGESPEHPDYYARNVAGEPIAIEPCGSYFDSLLAFDMIAGGHMDITILGALEVDSHGNMASHCIPGKFTPGMGGAMDLVSGSKQVFVAMEHTAKGKIKIREKCILPLTGKNCVTKIFTELCVFHVTQNGLLLTDLRENTSISDIKNVTEANFQVDSTLSIF